MELKHTKVMNFEGAFRGMRNPMNSWDKSDSYFGIITDFSDQDFNIAEKHGRKNHPEIYEILSNNDKDTKIFRTAENECIEIEEAYCEWLNKNGILLHGEDGMIEVAYLGPNDLALARKLVRAGSEHRKFLRQIFVSVDITAPLYWWKEADTYSCGVTKNSTSTMHKLASTPITIDCFETDDMTKELNVINDAPLVDVSLKNFINDTINYLEKLRQKYNETKDKRYWKELIRWLPESWLQTRTVTMNYENILNICRQRQGHKLSEWHTFINWAQSLPYASELIFY